MKYLADWGQTEGKAWPQFSTVKLGKGHLITKGFCVSQHSVTVTNPWDRHKWVFILAHSFSSFRTWELYFEVIYHGRTTWLEETVYHERQSGTNSYPCNPITSLVTSLPSISLRHLEVAHILTVAPVVTTKLPTSEPAFMRHSRFKKQEAIFIWLKMNCWEANDNVDIDCE